MGLEMVELAMMWEEEFDVRIPAKLSVTLVTPRHAADAIEALLSERGTMRPRVEIDAFIKTSVFEVGDVKEADYHLDARFVDDFGFG